MFLPKNLDISPVCLPGSPDNNISDHETVLSPHHDSDDLEDSPWIEVFSKKKSSKRKLVFRSNGSRPYMESKRS